MIYMHEERKDSEIVVSKHWTNLIQQWASIQCTILSQFRSNAMNNVVQMPKYAQHTLDSTGLKHFGNMMHKVHFGCIYEYTNCVSHKHTSASDYIRISNWTKQQQQQNQQKK